MRNRDIWNRNMRNQNNWNQNQNDNANDLKAKREKKEIEFQENVKRQQQERDFQKLVSENQEIDYAVLLSKEEYIRRRKFLFFHLNGQKTKQQLLKNDKRVNNPEEKSPVELKQR